MSAPKPGAFTLAERSAARERAATEHAAQVAERARQTVDPLAELDAARAREEQLRSELEEARSMEALAAQSVVDALATLAHTQTQLAKAQSKISALEGEVHRLRDVRDAMRPALRALLNAWPHRCTECGGAAAFFLRDLTRCAAHAPDSPGVRVSGVGPILRAIAVLEER